MVMRSFDYNTISDVIFHISYTAKDDASLKNAVETNIKSSINDKGLFHLFSLKHDFPTEFYKLLHPSDGSQQVSFEITKNHLPYWLSIQDVIITPALVFIQPKGNEIKVTDLEINGIKVDFNNTILGNLKQGKVSLTGPLTNKYNIASTTNSLQPEEIDDVLILVNIKVS